MVKAQGFWSYVQGDDLAEAGRIRQLAEDIAAQYEMATGEPLQLFLDQVALKWGDDWRKSVDGFLESAAFFVPVITPRYFMSRECRREFRTFVERSEALGVSELILPLYYMNVPGLNSDSSDDDLVELVRRFQWMDWRDLRFKEAQTEAYRRSVAVVVDRLVAANKQIESRSQALQPSEDQVESSDDEAPGTIDRLADLQEVMPKWNETIKSIAGDIEAVGKAMQEAGNKMANRPANPKEFVYRRAVARRLAQKLQAPSDRIYDGSREFVSQIHKVDAGVRTLLELGEEETLKGGAKEKEALCSFFESMRGLATSVASSKAASKGMVDGLANIEGLSRDLRPVLRHLSKGLTAMIEASDVTDGWVSLIERSRVECPE